MVQVGLNFVQRIHIHIHSWIVCPSSFKLQVCWLLSCARIPYSGKLIGCFSLAAFLHFDIY
ncbi:hypothetical protein CEQ28_015465 [Hafnia alvei]|nr:hypothetical protein CEQ28_015465 [Hafnia alvei]